MLPRRIKDKLKYYTDGLREYLKIIKFYLGYCPCGGKLEAWSWGKYKCDSCTETYYT